eukprot:PhF_6_TR40747/c0_g2_i5/m.61349
MHPQAVLDYIKEINDHVTLSAMDECLLDDVTELAKAMLKLPAIPNDYNSGWKGQTDEDTVGKMWETIVVRLYRCRFLSRVGLTEVADLIGPGHKKLVTDKIPQVSDLQKPLTTIAKDAIFPRAVQVHHDGNTTEELEANLKPAEVDLPFSTLGMHADNVWVDDIIGLESATGKPTLLLLQAKELKKPSQQSLPSLVNQTMGGESWRVMMEVYRKFNLVYVYVTINEDVPDDAFPMLTVDMMKGCKISVCTVTMKDIKSWCPMVAYSWVSLMNRQIAA